MRVPGTTWTWRAPDVDDDDGHDDGDVYGDLPPGPIEVVVTSGGAEHVKTVVVVPGKTVECVLER
ncbi:MAG: hypothetical protein K8T90_16510 [Planctomycetes bacterium]|nr:hypothetical protein [Planctomycetota bacterium]